MVVILIDLASSQVALILIFTGKHSIRRCLPIDLTIWASPSRVRVLVVIVPSHFYVQMLIIIIHCINGTENKLKYIIGC